MTSSAALRLLRAIALGLGFALAFGTSAAPEDAAPASASAAAPVLEVFVREGCPHCAAAKKYLAQLARERPALRIVYRPVDQDPEARDALNTVSRDAGVWPPGVPTFVFAGRVMVGFGEGEHAGRYLLALLDKGTVPAGQVESKLFGTLSASRLGLPLFTLALGLLDGFNPCAMWILLFLLSLLVHLRDRKRMALIAGTFVLVSGAVYYAFMAAWLNIFLAVGLSDAVRWVLGATALVIGAINVKDFVAWGHGPSLSIPSSAKPGLYTRVRQVIQAPGLPASLLAVAALAVVVNFIELLCTAGLPAIYTAVLAQQQLDAVAHYAYLLLYILGYITDDSLMVAVAVIALGSGKLTERAGRWLKFISGAVMLALGGILLLRPEWLV
ncbi:MAG: glutaredoxin family protein [Betaproteobacteria bacterium]|nr:glutaredoxin family protein [Betaproteobacteria bacterium]